MTILFIVLGLLLILLLFAIWPARLNMEQQRHFQKRNYAHRGLYTADGQVPENSMPAFHAAINAGYGIELDLQLTKDGQVAVFHDDTLQRVCDRPGSIRDYSYAQLQHFSLMHTDCTVPLFADVLREVRGSVPLIIEIKTCPNAQELCRKAWEILLQYTGKFCIESFDPRIVQWWRVHAKQVVRGQLTAPYRELRKSQSAPVSFLLANCLTNIIARPHFLAYSKEGLAPGGRLCLAAGCVPVVWTVHPQDPVAALQERNDATIFEFYTPRIRY